MDNNDFCLFGTFVKVNGFKGELNLSSSLDIPEKIKGIPFVFIEIDGILVPFGVNDIYVRNHFNAVLKLDGVDTQDDALEYVNKRVFIHCDNIREETQPESKTSSLQGFLLYDDKGNEIGKITEVIEIPENPVARIIINKKEVLIPVNKNVILSTDIINCRVSVIIPDGLLDIYLK